MVTSDGRQDINKYNPIQNNTNTALVNPHNNDHLTGFVNVGGDRKALIDIDDNNEDIIRHSLDICLQYSNIASVIQVNVPTGGGHSYTMKEWVAPTDGTIVPGV